MTSGGPAFIPDHPFRGKDFQDGNCSAAREAPAPAAAHPGLLTPRPYRRRSSGVPRMCV